MEDEEPNDALPGPENGAGDLMGALLDSLPTPNTPEGGQAERDTPPAEAKPAEATETPDHAARVAELETKLAELEKFAPAVAHLKDAGFEDGQQVLDRYTSQQAIADANRMIAERMGPTQQDLQSKVESGILTPEDAAALWDREAKLVSREVGYEIQQRQAQAEADAGFEARITKAAADHKLDEDGAIIVRGMASLGLPPETFAPEYAKMLTARDERVRQQAITDYEAARGERRRSPSPATGGAPPATGSDEKGFMNRSFADIVGLGKVARA